MNSRSKKPGGIKNNLIQLAQDFAIEFPKILDPAIINDPIIPLTKILQNLATRTISRFLSDYRSQKELNKVKTKSFVTNKPKASLIDLIKFIGKEIPDEDRMKILKSIFFSGISKNATEQDEIFAYEFLQTAKRLNATEILILKANFEIAQNKFSEAVLKQGIEHGKRGRKAWRRVIAQQMGYGDMDSVVLKYENNLESLGLISSRYEMDRLQHEFEPTLKFRLTEMGYKFCEFMTQYE